MDLVPQKILNPRVKRLIGVASGKGGVGKSTVAVLIAQALAARGAKVGAMDADITGPSLPRLMGLDSFRAGAEGGKLIPLENEEGIKLLSINLLNENEDDPVIWRGPLLAKALEQFWTDTDWGDLDYLIVDFPPGTSDVVLTAFQILPFDGIVVVATPQDYVSMIVRKSVKMAEMLNAKVIGLVENMRTMICPSCGKEIPLFDDGGSSGADRLGIPLLASLAWRPEVVRARSLRWKDLPEAMRADADGIALAIETFAKNRAEVAAKQ
ncbi:MAG TPA: Mrp/NBP35 family ATP-binding protein [Rectinemataceae bacterium]|nr:Mrp/NBP35 family ATP-binding protein [Rectinemataceae bacterium]